MSEDFYALWIPCRSWWGVSGIREQLSKHKIAYETLVSDARCREGQVEIKAVFVDQFNHAKAVLAFPSRS